MRVDMLRKLTRKEAGVTLIEMLVVAAIAAVIMALVFPATRNGMNTLELKTSAQHVAAVAKFARDQAIYRQRPLELEIDGPKRTISVFDSGGESRSFELPSSVSVKKILPEEQTATASGDALLRRFVFLPDGSAVEFEVVLENARRAIAISTDALTGMPKITDVAKDARL